MEIIETVWKDHKTVVISTEKLYFAINIPKDEKLIIKRAESEEH